MDRRVRFAEAEHHGVVQSLYKFLWRYQGIKIHVLKYDGLFAIIGEVKVKENGEGTYSFLSEANNPKMRIWGHHVETPSSNSNFYILRTLIRNVITYQPVDNTICYVSYSRRQLEMTGPEFMRSGERMMRIVRQSRCGQPPPMNENNEIGLTIWVSAART